MATTLRIPPQHRLRRMGLFRHQRQEQQLLQCAVCEGLSNPEIYGLFWSSRQFWLTIGSSQNHSTSRRFFRQPLFKSLLMSNLHPRNRSSANSCLSFLNSSSLHSKNIKKLSEAEFLNSKPKWRYI